RPQESARVAFALSLHKLASYHVATLSTQPNHCPRPTEQPLMSTSGSPTGSPPAATRLPGARAALILLLAINLFNYIDRQVLSATIPEIEKDLLPKPFVLGGGAAVGCHLGELAAKKVLPDPAASNKLKLGLLTTAFIVSYMIFALPFGW